MTNASEGQSHAQCALGLFLKPGHFRGSARGTQGAQVNGLFQHGGAKPSARSVENGRKRKALMATSEPSSSSPSRKGHVHVECPVIT